MAAAPTNLDDVVWSDDLVLEFNRGSTYKINNANGITLAKKRMILKAVGVGAAPIIQWNGAQLKSGFYLHPSGLSTTIQGLAFKLTGSSKSTAMLVEQNDVTIQRITTPQCNGGMVLVQGATDLLIEDMSSAVATGSNFILVYGRPNNSGGRVTVKNSIIRRCKAIESMYEHCLRLHDYEGITVEDCHFRFETALAGKWGHPFNVRDGNGLTVRRCRFSGYTKWGPLTDPSALNKPAAELAAYMALRSRNVRVESCNLKGEIRIEPGASNIVFSKCLQYSNGNSHPLINVLPPWHQRPAGTATFSACVLTHSGGEPRKLAGDSSKITFSNGTTYNGSPA
jgi:hypothetical protein